MTSVAAWLLLTALGGCEVGQPPLGGTETALECAPPAQTLAEFYAAADEVAFARLEASVARGTTRVLRMTVVETPWKAWASRPNPLRVDDGVEYVSEVFPPECALPLETGAVYVVFAAPDSASPSTLRVDGCTGSRVYVSASGANPQGFDDVPGAFVASQLDALSGMDVLRAFSANYPDESDPENATLVGMLDLDNLAHGGTVPVREGRDVESPLLATVASYDEVESREVGYEVGAAVAFARAEGWTRIRLADGRFGWVAPDDAGTWFPYGELVVNRLNYLTGEWSGHVWPDLGAGIPARSSNKVSAEREEYAAEVIESTTVGGTLWFRVNVLSVNPCEAGERRVGLSGWIPAFGPTGQPTAWYYSRGC